MAKRYDQRRKISFTMLLIIGLVIGFAIKRVGVGLIIGIVLGLLAIGIASGKKDE
jgi:uncharacterized membrane protein (UPF0136 family)